MTPDKMKYLVFCFLFLIFACNDEDNPVSPEINERGDIEKITNLGNYSTESIENIFASFQITLPFELNNSVRVLSVDYYTVDKNGNEQLASGAIFVPEVNTDVPVISVLHGTETYSEAVASVSPLNSVEGVSSLLLASLGYYVVAPDYLGFGVSDVNHPYMHAESLVPCIVDFLRAGFSNLSNENIVFDGNLFLTGYSEGGYLTLATQREIESNFSSEFNLTATAPLSGPYDLRGTADTIFINQNFKSPTYIAYLLSAYDEIYGWKRLDDIFIEPYNTMVSSLFNGSMRWGEISNSLPSSLNELVMQDFIARYLNDSETEVKDALDDNTLLNWKPMTPIHFFHGDEDKIVPYENVLKAVESFKSKGATDIQLTTIEGGNHETAGDDAIIGAISWFESLRKSSLVSLN